MARAADGGLVMKGSFLTFSVMKGSFVTFSVRKGSFINGNVTGSGVG